MCMCTGIVRNEQIRGYANVLPTSSSFRPHTHTLIPFEDREPTGLKVDTASSTWCDRLLQVLGHTGQLDHADGGTSHLTIKQRCKYTTLVDISIQNAVSSDWKEKNFFSKFNPSIRTFGLYSLALQIKYWTGWNKV